MSLIEDNLVHGKTIRDDTAYSHSSLDQVPMILLLPSCIAAYDIIIIQQFIQNYGR